MIFKLSDKEFKRVADEIIRDIGEEIRDELRDELKHLKSYYEDRIVDTIVYDDTEHVVGSEEWAVAGIDNGTDWHWSKFPNLDSLRDWVRRRKDDGKYAGAPDYLVNSIAYKVGKAIMKNGLEPTYFVDSTLGIFHRQVSIDV